LPGEEVEGSSLLERDLKVGDVDDGGVDPGAETELCEEPDEAAGEEDESPAATGGDGQEVWGDDEEDDVEREDVEQGRAVDKEERADNGGDGMGEVEVEQIGDGGAVSEDGETGCEGEGEDEQDDVIAVDGRRSLRRRRGSRRAG
jgi:hypothetical protein